MNYAVYLQASGIIFPVISMILLFNYWLLGKEKDRLLALCNDFCGQRDQAVKRVEAVEDRPPNLELQEFLHDMTEYGKGILIVTRAPVEGTLLRGYNGAK
jgi:hypothetical protein